MNRTTVLGALATGAAALVLAGCGGNAGPASGSDTTGAPPAASTSTATSAVHNAADVTFVQDMIPHHAQAVEMAELAPTQASSQQLKDLAAKIQAAQAPEIAQMQGFLQAWGLPAAPTATMGGRDHGMGGEMNGGAMSGMPGMMSGQQMQQLDAASGPAFDRMFLQMMIQHHQGAVQMAQTELRDGQNPEAKALAQRIITAQQAEIAQMQTMLDTS